MTESSTQPIQTDPRLEQLNAWLASLEPGYACDLSSLAPASSDASFRRYFRIASQTGKTFIVMDAPPTQEDCGPFVDISKLFGQAGLLTPQVHVANTEQGFLLLSDLGSQTLLAELRSRPESASDWYRQAGQELVKLQQATKPGALPPYDRQVLLREIALFDEWYLTRHLGMNLSAADKNILTNAYDAIVKNCESQSAVFVHRDYHSRNLMVQSNSSELGVLDFQDALIGPITYDLVSLLRDAYISWPEELVLDWSIRYWETARAQQLPVPEDFGVFWRDFEFMGLQRQLKVLGIFARLKYRDGKSNYIDDIPVVLDYALKAMRRYSPLGGLTALIERAIDNAQ
jgi:aminoglycoside/choline kinase family phosphotransferase